jgi:hypothetical protein
MWAVRRQGRFHLPCEPTRSTLNIIWSCGLLEGKGVSTSRVSPPGPLVHMGPVQGCRARAPRRASARSTGGEEGGSAHVGTSSNSKMAPPSVVFSPMAVRWMRRMIWPPLSSARYLHPPSPTAMKQLRIVTLGFGTARQRMVLERWTNPKPQRRTRSPRYRVPSWKEVRRVERVGQGGEGTHMVCAKASTSSGWEAATWWR